jgi:hypothetical protein
LLNEVRVELNVSHALRVAKKGANSDETRFKYS